MSYPNGGGYTATSVSPPVHTMSTGERSPKRQKMSPPDLPTFKTPQMPAQRLPQTAQSGAKQEEGQKTERTDINDLGDLLVSSGIDEKREEEFLSSSYHRARAQQQEQQTRPSSGPYGAQNLYHQTQQPSTFDLLSQNFSHIGQRPGNLGAPVKDEEEIAKELENKHRHALRDYNARQQQHLNDPFLYGNSMRAHLERIANDNGIKIPMTGLFDKISNKVENKDTKTLKHKEEGGGSIQLEKAPSILNKGVPLDHIMSLISLATNERIRNLVEDAYGLARGRQLGSDGAVPEEWTDLAVQSPEQASQLTNGHTPNKPKSQDKDDIGSVARALARITRAERQAEELRLKKRAQRRARKDAAASNAAGTAMNGDSSSQAEGTNGSPAGTANTAGLVAPEPPKMTKKERERLAKQDVSEEVQMKQANTALSMALGGGKKKYSWLSKGGSKGPSAASTPATATSRSGTPGTGSVGARPSTAQIDTNAVGKDGLPSERFDRKFGLWREDGPGGKDVQMRDWVNALEMDGREKKVLASALNKLGRSSNEQET